jgi:hypothetical protein
LLSEYSSLSASKDSTPSFVRCRHARGTRAPAFTERDFYQWAPDSGRLQAGNFTDFAALLHVRSLPASRGSAKFSGAGRHAS